MSSMVGLLVLITQSLLTGVEAYLWASTGSRWALGWMVYCALITLFSAMILARS